MSTPTTGLMRHLVWYFFNSHPPTANKELGQSAGAFHGSEINYALHNIPWGTTLSGLTLNWTSTDYQIADTLSQYWFNFIGTGNPNGGNLTLWEPSTNATKTTMELGDAWSTISIASDDVIEFFQDYFNQVLAY